MEWLIGVSLFKVRFILLWEHYLDGIILGLKLWLENDTLMEKGKQEELDNKKGKDQEEIDELSGED